MARFLQRLLRDVLLFTIGFVSCNLFSWVFMPHAYPTLELALYKHSPKASLLRSPPPPKLSPSLFSSLSAVETQPNQSITADISGNAQGFSSAAADTTGRKVILGFPFFREFGLLEERLRTHEGVVDCMIVAESKYSHSGEEKRLHMKEALEKEEGGWRVWRQQTEALGLKLVHVVDAAPNMFNKGPEKLWGQEVQSRRAIAQGLQECHPRDNDIVVVTDADEVLDSLAFAWLKHFLQDGQVAVVPLAWHLYNKCWIHQRPTEIPVAVTYKTLRENMHGDTHSIRAAKGKGLHKVHYRLRQYGGYHCSWCFGNDYDAFREKALNFNPGDGGERWRRQNWPDERIKRLRANGLWLDGKPHGRFICH